MDTIFSLSSFKVFQENIIIDNEKPKVSEVDEVINDPDKKK